MALEVRLRDRARLTKDVDLGLRDRVADGEDLRDRVVAALTADPYSDGFVLAAGAARRLMEDGDTAVTWRLKVAVELAGRAFGALQLDVSPRAWELDATDVVQLPNSLDFAGIGAPAIEIVDVNRHAAEKLHGMLKEFGERENTRVRDLIDLVILTEHGLLDPPALRAEVGRVWAERESDEPPSRLPRLPAGWARRYERVAGEQRLVAASFPAATARVQALWDQTFGDEE